MANNIDKASYRNKGGIIQRIVTMYKIAKNGIKAGKGCVLKRNAEFRLTDGAHLQLGDDVVIQDYAFFQLSKPLPKVIIGNDVVVGRGCLITAKNLIQIGDHTRIGSDVQIIDHSHGISRKHLIKDQDAIIGEVLIGKDVWIGVGAKILMNTKIGDGAVIGANAVVTGNIDAYAVAVGVPATIIKYRE